MKKYNNKYIIAGVVIVFIVVAGVLLARGGGDEGVWKAHSEIVDATHTKYINETLGFSLVYPSDVYLDDDARRRSVIVTTLAPDDSLRRTDAFILNSLHIALHSETDYATFVRDYQTRSREKDTYPDMILTETHVATFPAVRVSYTDPFSGSPALLFIVNGVQGVFTVSYFVDADNAEIYEKILDDMIRL